MLKLFEVLTWIGAICAFLMSFGMMSSGLSAPQQAAGIAFALALVIIPYCIAAMLQRKELIKRLSARA